MENKIYLNRKLFETEEEKIQRAVKSLRENMNLLDDLRKNTVNSWSGEAREQYNKDMLDGIKKIDSLIMVLDGYMKQMDEVVTIYENVEKKNQNLI